MIASHGSDVYLPEWAENEDITKVIILNNIAPNYTSCWFYCLYNLESIENINKINTINVTDMHHMFDTIYYIPVLDLSNFDTSNVTNMRGMFYSCECSSGFRVIFVGPGWNMSNVEDTDDMFYDCRYLIGQLGTICLDNNLSGSYQATRGLYAHIDGGTSNPGYLSDINGDLGYLWKQLGGKSFDDIADYDDNTNTTSYKNSEIEYINWDYGDIIKYNNIYYRIAYDSNDIVSFITFKAIQE